MIIYQKKKKFNLISKNFITLKFVCTRVKYINVFVIIKIINA